MALRDRLPMLLKMRKEHLITLRANVSDPLKDRTGVATTSLQGTLRFIGIAEFVIAGDVRSFRRHLAESARLGLRLFERHAGGETIDAALVSLLAYKDVFDALAAGDLATAKEYGGRLGGRLGGRPDIEEAHDHPFDRRLGYALKHFIVGTHDQMTSSLADFASICRTPENADFLGYATTFHGILHRDEGVIRKGLAAVVEGHKQLVRSGGVFHGLEDEMICVWGVGLANLARSRGLPVAAVAPFIPRELLCD